jgi:hypothetical protein
VYDSRFMHTDRRPDLYLDEGLDEEGKIVCQIPDTEDALPFGARVELASSTGTGGGTRSGASSNAILSSSRDWLWAKRGQFVAIVVPYRHGRHYATNIKDFKPVLKHLRRLHKRGFVHGDVRGFNMAMKNEDEGFLIDLDYGGKVDGSNPPKYPEGYKFDLADGDSRRATREEPYHNEGRPPSNDEPYVAPVRARRLSRDRGRVLVRWQTKGSSGGGRTTRSGEQGGGPPF